MDYKNYNDYELAYMVNESEESFEILYEKYKYLIKKLVLKYYNLYKKYGIEYDELKQEADIAFYKMVEQYRDSNLFYTFFNVSINNRLLNYSKLFFTKKNQFNKNAISIFQSLNNEDDLNYIDIIQDTNSINPEMELNNKTLFKKLYNYKFSLSFKNSCIYELYLNGFERKEIAILLDIDPLYISNLLYRIRKEIKKTLILL